MSSESNTPRKCSRLPVAEMHAWINSNRSSLPSAKDYPQLLPSSILQSKFYSNQEPASNRHLPSQRRASGQNAASQQSHQVRADHVETITSPSPPDQSSSSSSPRRGSFGEASAQSQESPRDFFQQSVALYQYWDAGAQQQHAESDAVDDDAPPPSSLQVIQASAPADELQVVKFKRESRTWSVSSFGGSSPSGEYDTIWSHKASDMQLVKHNDPENSQVSRLAGGIDTPVVEIAHDCELAKPHYNCDIDTATGEFLPPVDYPSTQMLLQGHGNHDARDLEWRSTNLTSALHIANEIACRKRIGATIRQARDRSIREETRMTTEVKIPTADATLRPATQQDLPAIAALINEVAADHSMPKIMLADTAKPQDLIPIYNECLRVRCPFIVALTKPADLMDRSKWPKGVSDEEYQEYLKFKGAQASGNASQPKIIGFAYVTEWFSDFLGRPCPEGKVSAQIKLLVHPDHRRKSIGSALLDRILLSVAAYHSYRVNYKWECKAPNRTYEDPGLKNSRKYAHMYIQAFFEGPEDSNRKWTCAMLKEFGFSENASFSNAVRSGTGEYEGMWFDMVQWELKPDLLADMPKQLNKEGFVVY